MYIIGKLYILLKGWFQTLARFWNKSQWKSMFPIGYCFPRKCLLIITCNWRKYWQKHYSFVFAVILSVPTFLTITFYPYQIPSSHETCRVYSSFIHKKLNFYDFDLADLSNHYSCTNLKSYLLKVWKTLFTFSPSYAIKVI